MSRLEAVARAQFYPTPDRVTTALGRYLVAVATRPGQTIRLLDPCAGEGVAAAEVASALGAESYGIELNAERAREAETRMGRVLCHTALWGVKLANSAFSVLLLNPPYDYDDETKRLEHHFLTAMTRTLVPGGVLALLIPQRRLALSARYLAAHYEQITCYRFPDPEFAAFGQVVLFGVRRRSPGADLNLQVRIEGWSLGSLPELPDVPGPSVRTYEVPAVTEGEVLFGTTAFDPQRAAAEAKVRGAWVGKLLREELWPEEERPVRPLMPLRKGHLAMLIAAGFLNNMMLEQDGERLLVKGRAYKESVEIPTEEKGKKIEREVVRTRVTTLDLASGEIRDVDQGGGLSEFLARYQTAITDAVRRSYPPRYTAQNREAWGIDLSRLTRRPLGAQADAIRAAVVSLQGGRPVPEPRAGLGLSSFASGRGTSICGTMGTGKAQPLTARVLTPTGWKAMRDIQTGDAVVNSQGGGSRVTGVFPQGKRDIYRVTMSDGSSTECCDEHLWLINSSDRKYHGRPGRVRQLSELRDELRDKHGNLRHFIPMVCPVEFAETELPVHPYVLGALLGDGGFTGGSICLTSADEEIIARVGSLLPEGVTLTHVGHITWRLHGQGRFLPNGMLDAMRQLGLVGLESVQKFIPQQYAFASREARVALLQGLLDTDGAVDERCQGIEYTTVSPQLAEGVRSLVHSLGGVASIREKHPTYVHKGEARQGATAYRLNITLPSNLQPFSLVRKAQRLRPRTKYHPTRAIASVEYVGRKEAQCIAVDSPDHLYVTDDYIVTHNTYMAIAAAWLAGYRRAIVLCPPHLVRKWKEEVEGTVPGGRATIVRTISDIERALATSGGTHYVILSREAAKLSCRWRPAFVTRKQRVHVPQGACIESMVCCPACHKPVLDEEGVPLNRFDLQKKKLSCASVVGPEGAQRICGEPLWQAQAAPPRSGRGAFTFHGFAPAAAPSGLGQGSRRYALADYIAEQCRGAFGLCILDECFPGWTPVSTPMGLVRIEDLRPGDEVLSLQDGEIVVRRVTRTIQKRLRQSLVRVTHESGSFVCTPSHKIYTTQGYVPAGGLVPGIVLTTLKKRGVADADHHQGLPGLLRVVSVLATGRAGGEDLQPELRGNAPGASATPVRPETTGRGTSLRAMWAAIHGEPVQADPLLQPALCYEGTLGVGVARCADARGGETAITQAAGRCISADAQTERGSCSAGEGGGGAQGSNVRGTAGRKRPADTTAAEARRGTWLDHRVFDPDGQLVMAVRDGRYRLSAAKDRGGVRRGVTPQQDAEKPGHPEGSDAFGARLGSAEVLERGDRRAPGDGAGTNPGSCRSQVVGVESIDVDEEWVYDLEVEDAHCYFADGVLVSNCHELKAKGTAQGLAAAAVAESCGRVLTLTGTIFGGYSSSLFYLLHRFSGNIRGEFGYHDEGKWVSRYGILERITKSDEEDAYEYGSYSKRRQYRTQTVERPGISPAVLFHLIDHTVFVRLEDVAENLPPYREKVHIIEMADDQKAAYTRFADDLRAAMMEALARGSRRLLGVYLQALLAYPDNCVKAEAVHDHETGHLLASAPALPGDVLYPKEQYLVNLARAEKARSRRVLAYVTHTESRDITPRLSRILEDAGLRVRVLKANTVKPEARMDWVNEQVTNGLDVLICHPKLVQTGLDLVEFPVIYWHEVEYSIYVMRQASRRSWRIGQTRPVDVHFAVYSGTLQQEALALVASKLKSALMVEGDLGDEGLSALNSGAADDLLVALAKKLSTQEASDTGSLEALFAEAKSIEDATGGMIGDADWGEEPVVMPEPVPAAPGLSPEELADLWAEVLLSQEPESEEKGIRTLAFGEFLEDSQARRKGKQTPEGQPSLFDLIG